MAGVSLPVKVFCCQNYPDSRRRTQTRYCHFVGTLVEAILATGHLERQ
jgi:hypothetical protein